MNQKKFEEGIKNLFEVLSAETDKEINRLLGESIKNIKESNLKIDSPEHFDLYINYKLKCGVDLLINSLDKSPLHKDKYNFIYQNYSFLESHIRNLCTIREGSSCCADKSRYIVEMYLNYSITGEIPEFNPEIEHYWIPKFGNNEMWINYCDSLYGLYYGQTESYFNTYRALIKCEKRNYKHTLHRWYIRFNDDTVIEFAQTWDTNIKNPLICKKDKEEYYILHKNRVQNKNFEPYEPNDEKESFIFKHYVKIPKSEIKEIYKVSEEKWFNN